MDIKSFDMHNRDLFDQAPNYAEKADIWRYEILYQYGGLYVDTDFKCLKSLDVLHEHFEFYCGMENIKRQVNISNALIGSIAQHPILKYCIEEMKDNVAYWNKTSLVKDQFCLATCVKTGIFYLTKAFVMVVKNMNEGEKEKIIALPPSYLYPINGRRRRKREAFDESFGVHLYDGTWYK